MQNILVNLPDPLSEFVNSQTAARGLDSQSDYFQALVREELKRKLDAEVEALIEEGLASEPLEWNDQMLANMKQEVMRRHAQRNGS